MPSLVEQLQSAALDRNVPGEDLLRLAKVVATKLELDQFLSWIDREMKGYGPDDDVPEYRLLSGVVQAEGPYHGWQTVIFEQNEGAQKLHRELTNHKARLPIGEISDLLSRGGRALGIPYGTMKVEGVLGEELVNAQLEVDRARFAGILDAVRNAVLEWALELEKAGIRGEGLTFSQPEKQRAHEANVTVNISNVENFSGVAGAVSGGSTVHSQAILTKDALNVEAVRQFVRKLKSELNELGLASAEKQVLTAQIGLTEAEAAKGTPDNSKLRSLLASIRRIAEGAVASATGSFAAQGVLLAVDRLLK